VVLVLCARGAEVETRGNASNVIRELSKGHLLVAARRADHAHRVNAALVVILLPPVDHVLLAPPDVSKIKLGIGGKTAKIGSWSATARISTKKMDSSTSKSQFVERASVYLIAKSVAKPQPC
jgi:hypothetical protein